MKIVRCIAVLVFLTFLTACATRTTTHTAQTQGTFKVGNPYRVQGTWYYPKEQYDLVETGLASWYGPGFDGQRTASGETYHADELTAAHRTLQMPSLVRVTNLDNGRSVVVRVNDRGPYARGRIMDVSSKAAELLGMKGAGTAKVRLQVLSAESMRIAQVAKTGASTRGYETAYNGSAETPAVATPSTAVEPNYEVAATEELPATSLPPVGPVPGHLTNGKFYPDPVVTQMPVTPTSIYVQAGSFTVRENADRLAAQLSEFHASVAEATIGGRQFYRVHIGPIQTVPGADMMLATVMRHGYNRAIIIVE